MLEHGGRARSAAVRFGIPVSDWLDLSTGIKPQAWPVPALLAQAWQRLPEDDDGLEIAARHHYGAAHLLAVAGTQAALRALPGLRPRSRVAVRFPSYAEHAHAWRRAGHAVEHNMTMVTLRWWSSLPPSPPKRCRWPNSGCRLARCA